MIIGVSTIQPKTIVAKDPIIVVASSEPCDVSFVKIFTFLANYLLYIKLFIKVVESKNN